MNIKEWNCNWKYIFTTLLSQTDIRTPMGGSKIFDRTGLNYKFIVYIYGNVNACIKEGQCMYKGEKKHIYQMIKSCTSGGTKIFDQTRLNF